MEAAGTRTVKAHATHLWTNARSTSPLENWMASAFSDAAAPVDENDPAYVALRAHRNELDTHYVQTAFPGERLYPMVLAGRLAGALVTGRRENGEAMPPDIDEAIRRVAAAVAIALAAIESDRVREENASLRQRLGVQAV